MHCADCLKLMADIEFIEPITTTGEDDQVIDLQAAAPRGTPCEACGSPIESLDKFCPACGNPNPALEIFTADVVEQEKHKYFRCDQCGSEVATDPDQRSYTCPFCDSTYVVEFSPDQTDRQRPEFVIGFAVSPKEAQEKFRSWIGEKSWFRPSDLRSASIVDKQKGVYLPFWSFSMLAESEWTANIGEYWYRTETYTTTDAKGKTVTHTRTVTETEWWPLGGRHHGFYSGYLVSGSRGLSQGDADCIKPFHLPALRRYEPYYLAGWLSEEYSVDRSEALAICKQEFYRRESRNISAFLPGDTHRNLQASMNFSQISSDLCLLPVYVLSYRYKEKLYRFLVNGQTGKTAGDKPWSGRRIATFVIVIVVLVLLFVFCVMAIAGIASQF